MKKSSKYDILPGHDGASLPMVGEHVDDLALRYHLITKLNNGWSSPEEGLRAYQALGALKVIPDEAVFYLVAAVLVDEIAPTRIMSFLDEIQEHEWEMRESEDREPLRVEDHWEFIAEHVTAETMREHQEWDMAHLFENDRDEFQGRVEAGRRFFHGI